MIFQNVNINGMNMAGNQEFMKICSAHPKCEGCPLKDKVAYSQGVFDKM